MAVVNGYATLAEVKAELRLKTVADDARLERKIEAASRILDDATHREFFVATEPRVFASSGSTVWINDAQAVTLAEESSDQSTWATVTGGWVTNPRLPIRKLELLAGEWARFVRVTATWGNPVVPAKLREATILYAVRLFKRPDTPEGVLVGDFGAARLAREDPDILKMVRPLARKVLG